MSFFLNYRDNIQKRLYSSNVLQPNYHDNNRNIKNYQNNNCSGHDMRYNISSDIDNDTILQIVNLNGKMNLLKKLENPAISINQKIRIIKKDKPKIIIPNLKAGGLFKDWENK